MKRVLLIGLVGILVLIVGSCMLGSKTVSYTSSGVCVEVTTSDKDVYDAAIQAGYEEGPCEISATSGTCKNYVTIEGESFSAVFDESMYSASEGEATCEILGGTWEAN
jgi:hypothetical protein